MEEDVKGATSDMTGAARALSVVFGSVVAIGTAGEGVMFIFLPSSPSSKQMSEQNPSAEAASNCKPS